MSINIKNSGIKRLYSANHHKQLMGRLVITHSTYIDGLVKWGESIAKRSGIKTVTPGVIGRTKGSVEKLVFRITRQTKNGYKLIARNKKSYQEVYIVSDLEIKEFRNLLNSN